MKAEERALRAMRGSWGMNEADRIAKEITEAQQEARAELLEKVLQRVHHMANVWNLHPQAEREFTEAVRALLEGK